VSTLFFVPVVYAAVHQRLAARKASRTSPVAATGTM
jgi:hypothetical protein